MEPPEDCGTRVPDSDARSGQSSPAKSRRQVSTEQGEPGHDRDGGHDTSLHDQAGDGAAAEKARMQKKLRKLKDAYDRRGMQA